METITKEPAMPLQTLPKHLDYPTAETRDRETAVLRDFAASWDNRTVAELWDAATSVGMDVVEFARRTAPARLLPQMD